MKNLLILILFVSLILSGCALSEQQEPINTGTEIPGNSEPLPNNEIQNKNILDLSGQQLEKIPEYVFNRDDLEELDVSDNKLMGSIQGEIGRLQALKTLKAGNNLMTGVPAEIGQLKNLQTLDLSNNQLTGLPNELGNLKNLKTLNISGNDYSEFDLNIIKEGLPDDINIIK